MSRIIKSTDGKFYVVHEYEEISADTARDLLGTLKQDVSTLEELVGLVGQADQPQAAPAVAPPAPEQPQPAPVSPAEAGGFPTTPPPPALDPTVQPAPVAQPVPPTESVPAPNIQ
jgi:hypothetical protein